MAKPREFPPDEKLAKQPTLQELDEAWENTVIDEVTGHRISREEKKAFDEHRKSPESQAQKKQEIHGLEENKKASVESIQKRHELFDKRANEVKQVYEQAMESEGLETVKDALKELYSAYEGQLTLTKSATEELALENQERFNFIIKLRKLKP